MSWGTARVAMGVAAALTFAGCGEETTGAADAPAEATDIAAAEPAPAPAAPAPAAAPAGPPATGPGPLPGWTTIGNGTWSVEGEEIVGVGAEGMSFLATEQSYADFRITLEFMLSNPGNSGVFFRCADMAAIADTSCYEVNIFDERPDQSGRTGGIPNIAAPTVEIDGQDGQWHSYDITVQGDHIVVVLDGQTTVDVNDSTHTTPNPIALQVGAGENTVRFRNVQIEAL